MKFRAREGLAAVRRARTATVGARMVVVAVWFVVSETMVWVGQ